VGSISSVKCYSSSHEYSPLVAKLIETCYRTPVIKLKEIAEALGISVPYAHELIKRLKRDMYFKIWAVPHHERLRLRLLRCFLQVSSATYHRILLETLSQHDFVAYIAQCFGSLGSGIWCDFLVPEGKDRKLFSFFESLRSHKIIGSYVLHATTSFKNVVMGFEWYDFSTHTWRFDWQALLNDVLSKIDSQEPSYFYDLEPSIPRIKFDFYDLFILHHLEQDVFTPLTSLASKLGTSPQNLSHHFRNHVLRGGLIRATRPYWYPYLLKESSSYILKVEFEDIKGLSSFLESLHRKPIAHTCTYYGQAVHPLISLTGFLPYGEFFNFANFLDLLKDYGIIKDYCFYILDLHNSYVKCLPCHCYDEALGWCFDLEPYLEKILKMVKKVQEGRAKSIARLASAADSRIEPV
jgi:DNA-binding Lrp family transcriptional regulator